MSSRGGSHYRSGYPGSSYAGSAPSSSYGYRQVDRYSSLDKSESGSKSPVDSDLRNTTPAPSVEKRETSVEYDDDVRADVKADFESKRNYSDHETPVSSDDEVDDYEPPEPALEQKAVKVERSESPFENDRDETDDFQPVRALKTPDLESYEPEEPKIETPRPVEEPKIENAAEAPSSPQFSEPLSTDVRPFTRLDSEYEALKLSYEKLNVPEKQPVDFRQLDFFDTNFHLFRLRREQLVLKMKAKLLETQKKRILLWKLYDAEYKDYDVKRQYMNEQLQLIHGEDDDMKRELESIDISANKEVQDLDPTGPQGLSRRNRRHGDLVTTEAEFQEILQSLEKQQNQDPQLRARKGAAPIPDMILDSEERDYVKYMDSNNLVNDKGKWTLRVKTDFINNFNSSEHVAFCEAFCLYPKRFGAISRHMGGLRTPEECVVYYYMTKKAVNYKQMAAQFKKRSMRKIARKGKPKSRNTSQSSTPVSTPTTEKEYEEYTQTVALPNESFGEEMYTETGRRKRAAAPTFEGPKKKETTVIQIKKRKKKKEDDTESQAEGADNETVDQAPPPASPKQALAPAPILPEPETPVQESSGDTDKKKNILSYWSITEANEFPRLLALHGTNWIAIADSLSTKTATMVRNYFIRNAERNNWNQVVAEREDKLPLSLLESQPRISTSPSQPDPAEQPTSNGSEIAPVPAKLTNVSPMSNGTPQALAAMLESAKESAMLQKPSIMSLLNSDSSSSAAEHPPARNNLRDLLNSAGSLH